MKYFYFIIVIFILSCTSQRNASISIVPIEKQLDSIKYWHQKDYQLDGLPGISFDKWYAENKQKAKNNIIVATLDCQIDTNHEDLQGQLWKNTKEIPNNNLDDDNNGYIDDVEGWNFLGTKSGNYIIWQNYECVRIVRKWKPFFENKKEDEINKSDLQNFKEYKTALIKLNKEIAIHDNWLKSLKYSVDLFPKVKDTLKYFFPKEDYTYKQLDSMYKKYKINDKTFKQRRLDNDKDLGALIDFMMLRFENNEKTLDKVIDMSIQVDSLLNKCYNINFNERVQIGDNPNILEKGYGNCKINNSNIAGIRKIYTHNTSVSSIIAANRENNIGVKGFSNQIKILPISMSGSGDEHDKDIAMAIYYALDNGAKVINMSFSKDFSAEKKWMFDAFKYAEQHNVLLVHCSGNDYMNIDTNSKYPNDNDYLDLKEKCNNFICVGSVSEKLDSTFVSKFSNYGKENVDLFAPGDKIYVAQPENKYDFNSGTSFSAPMVSGTAALIWLYYPNLTVQEVKQIILESGTSYDLEVLIPGGEGKKAKFSELSKSGKVLNVYNAMKMAKEISKKKK